MPDAGNPTEAYDFHEEIDEYNATALNALVDFGEGETEGDKSIGEAIQLQLAAFVAFGQVKGRGEGKPKGKRKDMRLLGIKAKLKCLRCGAYGHWAGDPVCKFPGAKGNASAKDSKPPSNPRPGAHSADFSDSSFRRGFSLNAQITSCKHGHQERSCLLEGTQFEAPYDSCKTK
jgi:hypothetical protein